MNYDAGADSPLAALSEHLPFLIELRDFVAREAEGRCTDLLGYLAYCGREFGFGFNENSLEEQFSRRPSLIIIDGLDEIFDPRRRRLMVDQIIGLTGRYPDLRILITSRIAGFDDNPFRAAEFAIATLIDLTPEQIEEFAKTWFTIVFSADPGAAARASNDLLEALQRRPQLQTIAGNPMILTIMATVARHKRLGRSRTAIYDQALELLCYNWDYKRGLGLLSDSPLIDLQPDDTPLMLRRIAWRMQEHPEGLRANAIEEANLRSILEDFFQRDWHFEIPKARRAASEMLERLQVRNWVLTLRGPALYGFVHRTFLEYLCALELSERFRSQQLDTDTLITDHVMPRLDDDSWHEVLRLLVGLLPPSAGEQILVAILTSTALATTDWARLALAWQGLAEIEPRFLPNLMQTGARLIDTLYDWLANGSSLAWESLGAISEAAQATGPIPWPAAHPPSGEWPSISFETQYQGSYRLYSSTMGLFAAWFTQDPETETLLRFRAIKDQDEICRGGALTSLARHFPEDPGTKELLRTRAMEDPDGVCRAAALTSLAKNFHEEPATKTLLRARAIEDTDVDCRIETLTALAQVYREDPATKALLRARAVDDSNALCRATALTGLARNFRYDPTTKALLRARAFEDTDRACRGTAFLRIAEMLNSRELELLASEDLDGLLPGLDPREPITFEDLARAATKLETTEDNIRSLYGALAKELPLIFG